MRLRNLSFVSLLLLGSIAAMAAVEPFEVVKINNRSISLEEFNKRFDEARKLPAPPTSRKAFLEDLIRYEVGVQEAEKKNIDKDPVVKERIRQQLYVGLIEKELADKINKIDVSKSEMHDYYRANPEIRSAHILIQVKPGANDSERAIAKKRAQEILSEVKGSKKKFEELVGLYSDDLDTKKIGGDVGFQNRINVIAPYYEALVKLGKGEISGVVETKNGFHIIKMIEKHSFDEADKDVMRNSVFEKKRLAIFNDYFNRLKKNYKITVNNEIVK